MLIYRFDEYICKLSLIEKIHATKKILDECGLKIGYVLFDTLSEDTFSESRQKKLKNIIGASDACKFATYPHHDTLLVTDPERLLSDISRYPQSFFRGFSHMYLGGIKHVEDDEKTDYTTDQMMDGKGFITRSICLNIRYYKDKVSLAYPLPISDKRFYNFVRGLLASSDFKFDYNVTQARLTEEEENIPVNIPKLKNAEKYEGIFRYEPNKNYDTGEKVRTSINSALKKCSNLPILEKVDAIIGIESGARFLYRNKENHIVSAVLSNSTAGKAGHKGCWVSPVATFVVTYEGVNFKKWLCSRFCHNTSQAVFNDFVRECLQFLTEIIEETDSFAHTVTELKTPWYFDEITIGATCLPD